MYLPPVLLALWNIDLLVFNNAVARRAPRRALELIQRWEMLDFAIYFTLAVVALAFTYRQAAADRQEADQVDLPRPRARLPAVPRASTSSRT